MKRNTLVKRFGIASLCLAILFSAFSGMVSLVSKVALAEETTVQATDLVYTKANVTQDENGLRISSDDPYSATFKTVLSGNTTLKFRFAEKAAGTYGPMYGDFKIRITDATDDSNYFVLQYYVSRTHSSKTQNIWTGLIMQYGDEIRTCGTPTSGSAWFNFKPMGIEENNTAKSFAPHLLQCGNRGSREGVLTFTWSNEILTIKTNACTPSSATTMYTLAAFDGTYDSTAAKNGFVNGTSWGLPKLNFPNGYTVSVSSDFTSTQTTDRASDVLFTSIASGGSTYNFKTTTELPKDSNMTAFSDKFAALTEEDIPTLPAGKAFVGWKDTVSGSFYPAFSIMQTGKYEAFIIDYDTINGASVRLASKSGIRFQTIFNAEQYADLKQRGSILSFGTLIAYTDTLTSVGKDFTIANYQDQETFVKVENTKGVFDYTDRKGTSHIAYTVGVVDIQDYTKAYSARGYLEILYSNGVTGFVYTDFNTTDNSRSIAEVAYRLKTIGVDEYNAMTSAKKAIIDAYAEAYPVA